MGRPGPYVRTRPAESSSRRSPNLSPPSHASYRFNSSPTTSRSRGGRTRTVFAPRIHALPGSRSWWTFEGHRKKSPQGSKRIGETVTDRQDKIGMPEEKPQGGDA